MATARASRSIHQARPSVRSGFPEARQGPSSRARPREARRASVACNPCWGRASRLRVSAQRG
eukprot:13126244-Alexandrium_andersonii.AAC.1